METWQFVSPYVRRPLSFSSLLCSATALISLSPTATQPHPPSPLTTLTSKANITAKSKLKSDKRIWSLVEPLHWSTHTASWMVELVCLLIGWNLSSSISAHRWQNQHLTKGYDNWEASTLVSTYWLVEPGWPNWSNFYIQYFGPKT